MKYRAVLQNVTTGNKIRNIESIWVDDVNEANRIGERGLEFYGGSHFIIEEKESE